MLLPQVRLRQIRLARALRGYPLYDPPHKVEERRLSKELAGQNFEYFMIVRQQRFSYFREWLHRCFGLNVTPDEKGMRALNDWGVKYAGLLQVIDSSGEPSASYFTYDPLWSGKHVGNNALFDMGIALGESIIASCPKLHWALDPISAILPRLGRKLRKAPGMGFQRPELTGYDDPVFNANPLHWAYGFSDQMFRNMTTFGRFARYRALHWEDRRDIKEEFLNAYKAALSDYPAGDPHKLRGTMSQHEYFDLIDKIESEGEDEGDE